MTPAAGFRRATTVMAGLVLVVAGLSAFAKDGARPDDEQSPIVRVEGAVPAKTDEQVTGKAFLSVDRLPAGSTCRVVMVLDIAEGWNIKTNPPKPKNFIATQFTIKSKHGTVLKDVRYPEGKKVTDEKSGEQHTIYEEKVLLYGTLEIPKDAAGQTEELELNVRYQACQGFDVCLIPKTIKLTGKLDVAEPGETVKQINSRYFSMQAQKPE